MRVKALKCKVFQIIRCLIKPVLKNSTQTIFQGGTPWVAQLLNNMKFGWYSIVPDFHLLSKWKSIESKLKSIESKLKSSKNNVQKKCWGRGRKKMVSYSVD